MSRLTWILGGLLALALMASYLSSHRKQVASAGDKTLVLDGSPEKIDTVRFERASVAATVGEGEGAVNVPATEALSVLLEGRHDDLGRYFDVTVKQGDRRESFTAGRAAERLMETLAPLYAHRALKGVDEARLEQLGLARPDVTLEIGQGGRTARFLVGGSTYGSARRYLRPDGKRDVYLVDGAFLRTLEQALAQLPERELLAVERRDLEEIVVTAGDRSVTMLQKGAEDRHQAYWVRASAPEERVELFANWIDKLFRLRVETYVDASAEPEGLEAVALAQVRAAGRRLRLELLRGAGEGGEPEYYARGNHLRRLVKLPRVTATEVVADLPSVVAE